jgi:hypothetical protein
MDNIRTSDELRIAIRRLEIKNNEQKQDIEDKFHDIVEGLRPRNLLKKYVGNFLTDPLKSGVVNLALVAGTGFVFKRVLFGNTTGKLAKLFTNLAQIGISSFVAAKSAKTKEIKNRTTY